MERPAAAATPIAQTYGRGRSPAGVAGHRNSARGCPRSFRGDPKSNRCKAVRCGTGKPAQQTVRIFARGLLCQTKSPPGLPDCRSPSNFLHRSSHPANTHHTDLLRRGCHGRWTWWTSRSAGGTTGASWEGGASRATPTRARGGGKGGCTGSRGPRSPAQPWRRPRFRAGGSPRQSTRRHRATSKDGPGWAPVWPLK